MKLTKYKENMLSSILNYISILNENGYEVIKNDQIGFAFNMTPDNAGKLMKQLEELGYLRCKRLACGHKSRNVTKKGLKWLAEPFTDPESEYYFGEK